MVYLQSYALLPMVETLIQWTVESSIEKQLEEKRRAELSARIASGEFTVEESGYALEFTMLLFLAILIVNVVGIRCVCLLFYRFLNALDSTVH